MNYTYEVKLEMVDGRRVAFTDVADSGFEENKNVFFVAYQTDDGNTGFVEYFPINQIFRVQNMFKKPKE